MRTRGVSTSEGAPPRGKPSAAPPPWGKPSAAAMLWYFFAWRDENTNVPT